MIKKASLMTALSVTAFSGWAQDSNSDTLVVTANRFQQPVNTVLAPTDIVTRDDIDRWQSKDLNDVMRRLPGVDIARNGGMGQSASLYVRGTEARHVLVLIDGVPMARPGISNGVDISQIPISLVQRVEYIRGPRSAVYGSGAIGGVVNIITMTDAERSQINAGAGTNGYQSYDGAFNKRFGDTLVTAAGAIRPPKGLTSSRIPLTAATAIATATAIKCCGAGYSISSMTTSRGSSAAMVIPPTLTMTRVTGATQVETMKINPIPNPGIPVCTTTPEFTPPS